MRFLFVDQIRSIDGNKIVGTKFFKVDEPLSYDGDKGKTEVAPGVISEAIGQLVSWLAISKNDFVARPVFLFADHIEVVGPVRPGSQVELEATIESMDNQMIVFSGLARIDGNIVHRVSNVSGYMMPLGELEDPHTTRTRFESLLTTGLKLDGHGETPYAFSDLIDSVAEVTPGKLVNATKTMREDEAFYKDHFPRNPVTPIVMINEMIGQATKRMFDNNPRTTLRVSAVKNIKIKNFIRPGESCTIKVTLKSREATSDGERVVTIADLSKGGKRILRGVYEYQLQEAANERA